MGFIEITKNGAVAALTLTRGKVNALNNEVVAQIRAALEGLESDPRAGAIVITATGSFFSFGFDIPEFLSFSRAQFSEYLTNFTALYRYLFCYPKPVVAALNGHTIAGGCMLALTCDCRVMVQGKARISLNEIGFGSSVFAGSTEMLRFCAGSANAATVLYSGGMYPAEEAKHLGLVDEVVTAEDLMDQAFAVAARLAAKPQPAFASIKALLRKTTALEMETREQASIEEFVEIWYSDQTWAKLQDIKIR